MGRGCLGKRNNEGFWGVGNVVFLHLGAGYMGMVCSFCKTQPEVYVYDLGVFLSMFYFNK